MDDPETALSVLNSAGLDGATIMAIAQKDEIKNILKENTNSAANKGVFGVPTFFVGSELFYWIRVILLEGIKIKEQIKSINPST